MAKQSTPSSSNEKHSIFIQRETLYLRSMRNALTSMAKQDT
ncbi:hypothetical protein BVRB_6g135420 [Beta vulgaris subsp. vulgaris]|nr:hypothetical protein BVRB_6g135420 [Beta vulgaris subsp. vulgaris]